MSMQLLDPPKMVIDKPKQHYAILIGVKSTDIKNIEILPIEGINSRSRVSKVTLDINGQGPIYLVEKESTAKERRQHQFSHADHHEAKVLEVITDRYPQLRGSRSYEVPKFVHHYHDSMSNIITTRYIGGNTLSSQIEELDAQIVKLREPAKEGGKFTRPAGPKRRRIKRIAAVREAYVLLGVGGIAELIHDLRGDFRKPIEDALKSSDKGELTIYNPTNGGKNGNGTYYERTFSRNLEIVLKGEDLDTVTAGINPGTLESVLDNLRQRVVEDHPFYPIKKRLIDQTNEGDIILSDCHPGQIAIIPDPGLDSTTNTFIRRGSNSKQEMDRIKAEILNRGKIGIIDLGDLRVGPASLDFIDYIGNHALLLAPDQRRSALRHFAWKGISLSTEAQDVNSVYLKLDEDFPLFEVYRYVRHAARSSDMNQRRRYLSQTINALDQTSKLTALRDFIRPSLVEMQGIFRRIAKYTKEKKNQ